MYETRESESASQLYSFLSLDQRQASRQVTYCKRDFARIKRQTFDVENSVEPSVSRWNDDHGEQCLFFDVRMFFLATEA